MFTIEVLDTEEGNTGICASNESDALYSYVRDKEEKIDIAMNLIEAAALLMKAYDPAICVQIREASYNYRLREIERNRMLTNRQL